MRIAIVIPSLQSGGAERVSVTLAEAWADRGWEVHVITISAASTDFYALPERVTRHALGQSQRSPSAARAVAANVRRVVALRRRLQAIGPDVVVGMMSSAAALAIAACRPGGRRVIAVEHNYPPRLPLPAMWDRLRRLTYPHADRVVMLTSEGLEWLNATIPRAKGAVIPNAVRLPMPVAEPILPPEDHVRTDERLLLAVGRLTAQKGFDRLVEAFGRVAADHPEWRLVVLGEGEGRRTLVASADALSLGGRVVFPGVAGNVAQWYERADLFVLSSRFEGFPMTLMEAMAHGRTVLSYDCDTGPRDLITDGVDGVLVAPETDGSGLAAALDHLMSDGNMRCEMAGKALAVRERYSMERILGLWDAVLTDRPAATPGT